MSEAKHTPGPWRYSKDSGDGRHSARAYVWGAKVSIQSKGNLDFTETDMRLIAAAPDLLDALQQTLALALVKFGNLDSDANKVFDGARSAIARATGKGE